MILYHATLSISIYSVGLQVHFYQRNKACLDPLNSITNLVIEVGSHTRNSHDSLSGAINLSTPFCSLKFRHETVSTT